MNSVKFSSSRHSSFGFVIYVFFLLGIPIYSYFLYPIIAIPGILVLAFFWIIFLIGIISHLKATKVYCEITDKEIRISDGNSIVNFDIKAIQEINTQALVSKRMGVYETFPYLVLKIEDKSKNKLNSLSNSKEYGFIQKIDNLSSYMGDGKGDLYLLMSTLKENDLIKINNIFKKSLTHFKPLVKTNDKEEYEKIVKDYFVE